MSQFSPRWQHYVCALGLAGNVTTEMAAEFSSENQYAVAKATPRYSISHSIRGGPPGAGALNEWSPLAYIHAKSYFCRKVRNTNLAPWTRMNRQSYCSFMFFFVLFLLL